MIPHDIAGWFGFFALWIGGFISLGMAILAILCYMLGWWREDDKRAKGILDAQEY